MDVASHRVVVCGGGDFSAGQLVKQLLHDGVDVPRTFDIKPHEEWYQVHPGVEAITADLKQGNLKESDACHRAENVVLCSQLGARLGWKSSTLVKAGLRNTHTFIESQSEALACV